MSWLNKLARVFGFEGRGREWPPFPVELRESTGLAEGASESLRQLDDRLNRACRSGSWLEHVKARVFAKHPGMTDAEYEWLWLELRRFFLMTAITNHVPMFSMKVDDIWHEMLLFSREYEVFCRGFAGRTIHHEPHVKATPKQESARARAWFELIYGTTFQLTETSERVLGAFRKRAMPASELQWLEESTIEEIQSKLFVKSSPDQTVLNAARQIAEEIHTRVGEAREYVRQRRTATRRNDDYISHYAAGLLIFSMLDDGDHSGSGGGDSSCSGGASCGGGCGGG